MQKKSSHEGCSTLLLGHKVAYFLFCLANIRCHGCHVNMKLRQHGQYASMCCVAGTEIG
jgi:hypothetical protein